MSVAEFGGAIGGHDSTTPAFLFSPHSPGPCLKKILHDLGLLAQGKQSGQCFTVSCLRGRQPDGLLNAFLLTIPFPSVTEEGGPTAQSLKGWDVQLSPVF